MDRRAFIGTLDRWADRGAARHRGGVGGEGMAGGVLERGVCRSVRPHARGHSAGTSRAQVYRGPEHDGRLSLGRWVIRSPALSGCGTGSPQSRCPHHLGYTLHPGSQAGDVHDSYRHGRHWERRRGGRSGKPCPSGRQHYGVNVPKACGYCKNPLEADWAHCPRCGTPVVPGTPTVPK